MKSSKCILTFLGEIDPFCARLRLCTLSYIERTHCFGGEEFEQILLSLSSSSANHQLSSLNLKQNVSTNL